MASIERSLWRPLCHHSATTATLEPPWQWFCLHSAFFARPVVPLQHLWSFKEGTRVVLQQLHRNRTFWVPATTERPNHFYGRTKVARRSQPCVKGALRGDQWPTTVRPFSDHGDACTFLLPPLSDLWATDLLDDLCATVLNMLKTSRRPWRPWRCLDVLCTTLERPRQPFCLCSAFNGDLASYVVVQGRHKGRSPCVKGRGYYTHNPIKFWMGISTPALESFYFIILQSFPRLKTHILKITDIVYNRCTSPYLPVVLLFCRAPLFPANVLHSYQLTPTWHPNVKVLLRMRIQCRYWLLKIQYIYEVHPSNYAHGARFVLIAFATDQ